MTAIHQPLPPEATIRVCSPSRSIGMKLYGTIELARRRLSERGLTVEIASGDLALVDDVMSMSAELRADELTQALTDASVSAVMCSTGGWNAIDILDRLNWDRLRPCTKPVIGFSDNTILTTAFYARLGWQTYYGPNLATIGEDHDADYTLDYLLRALAGQAFDVTSPRAYSEPDETHPGRNAYVEEDPGMRIVTPGLAEGTILGGNLGTLFLLQGTSYWPRIDDDMVLCLEEDDLADNFTLVEAFRRIVSLLEQVGLVRQHPVGS